MTPCPIRAIVSNYSTHLLDLPGSPCFVPEFFNVSAKWGPDWYRRFNGHMICTKQVKEVCHRHPTKGSPNARTPVQTTSWLRRATGLY